MADGSTPRGYTLPEVGGSVDTWGSKLNQNWTDVDGDVTDNETAASAAQTDATQALSDAAAAQATADAALPKAGGTMTGKVDVYTADLLFEALGAVSGTVDLDVSAYNYFQMNLTGTTTFTISNATPTANHAIAIIIELTSAGEDVTWPAGVKWAYGQTEPDLSSTGIDVITLITTDGTNWTGAVAQPDVR